MLFTEFVEREKRIPMITTGDQPWKYRGWLLYYIQQLHENPRCAFPDRWGYWTRIKLGLPTGSIPQVRYSQPCKAAIKNIETCMEIIGAENKYRWWGNFTAFLDWLSYAIGIEEQQSNLEPQTQRKLYEAFDAGLWLQTPYDYLGDFICTQRGTGWNPHAFYPTPHTLVTLMIQSQFNGAKNTKWQTLCDPCVGTGRILMEGGNYCLRLFGQDIDRTMIRITKINGAFFVPWMVGSITEKDQN